MGRAIGGEEERFSGRVEALSWGLLGGLGAASALTLSPPAAGGFLLGGLICILNFKLLLVGMGGDGFTGRVRLRSFLRLFAVLASIALVVKSGLAEPISMLAGLSLIPVSITIVGLVMARERDPKVQG